MVVLKAGKKRAKSFSEQSRKEEAVEFSKMNSMKSRDKPQISDRNVGSVPYQNREAEFFWPKRNTKRAPGKQMINQIHLFPSQPKNNQLSIKVIHSQLMQNESNELQRLDLQISEIIFHHAMICLSSQVGTLFSSVFLSIA